MHHRHKIHHLLRLVIASLVVAALVGPALAADWRWQLPGERYQKMNTFERAQYDKAAALVKAESYAAAASEFEKFKAQFPDSVNLSHMLFMQGYCLNKAKQRHTAIKVFNEVMDFFGDNVEDAGAALYWMGVANVENGDILAGMKCFKELAEDKDYRKHPLAAGGLRRLADNCWDNKQYDQAVKYWKQVVADFAGRNDDETRVAAESVTAWYIKNRDYSGYESWLVNDKNRDEVAHRRWVMNLAWNVAWNGFERDWDKYTPAKPKEKPEDMQAFFLYAKAGKPWWEKANDVWGYYERLLNFLVYRWGDKEQREAIVNDAVAWVKTLKDKADADAKYARLVDLLKDGGVYDRARYCLTLMSDRVHAAYKDYELLAHERKWNDAVARLEEIEKMGVPAWQARAMEQRASAYKDALRKYEQAITLYQQINKPPGTLWAIQEAYIRWGKLKEALATLTEIENMFPDDASRAAWHKAMYLHQAKDGKQAVAQARRLLKMYPKSRESSAAHQLLESYGIATGGGVSDQD